MRSVQLALVGPYEHIADRIRARGVDCLCVPVRHADSIPEGTPVWSPADVLARLGVTAAAPSPTALAELSLSHRHLTGGPVVATDAATAAGADVPVRLIASPVRGIDIEARSRSALRRRAEALDPGELVLLATAPKRQSSRHRVFIADDAVVAITGGKDQATARRFAADVIAQMPIGMPAGWCMDVARSINGAMFVSGIGPSFCADPMDADPAGFASSVIAAFAPGQERFAWVSRPRLSEVIES